MNGRSHQKIAMLSYAIVATVPTINSMTIFNNRYIHIPMGISLIGLFTASLSGLLVDADSQNSKINHMNPFIGISNNFKRTTIFLTYISSSAILMMYNLTNSNDIFIYIICFLLIGIAVFPHRTFLHSIEGVLIFTISASYVFNKLGYNYLTGCFFVGYISHIYWGDIFTKEGVPILSTPRSIVELLKKIGIRNNLVYTFEKLANLKLKLPPYITTGSTTGNLFEIIYIIVLFVVVVIGFNVYGGQFKII